jgi:hypothetical protein
MPSRQENADASWRPQCCRQHSSRHAVQLRLRL